MDIEFPLLGFCVCLGVKKRFQAKMSTSMLAQFTAFGMTSTKTNMETNLYELSL